MREATRPEAFDAGLDHRAGGGLLVLIDHRGGRRGAGGGGGVPITPEGRRQGGPRVRLSQRRRYRWDGEGGSEICSVQT